MTSPMWASIVFHCTTFAAVRNWWTFSAVRLEGRTTRLLVYTLLFFSPLSRLNWSEIPINFLLCVHSLCLLYGLVLLPHNLYLTSHYTMYSFYLINQSTQTQRNTLFFSNSLPKYITSLWSYEVYTSFQNGFHFSTLLFTCKLAPVASW